MRTLELCLENDGRNWTVRPNQEYIIGSDTDCQISLPEEGIASQQLKFSFNTNSQIWYVHNLDRSNSVYVNNQPLIIEYPITDQVQISIGNSWAFVATPKGSNASDQLGTQQSTEERYINRGFFDKEDPQELRGSWIKDFSISLNQLLGSTDQEKLKNLRSDLYKTVCNKLRQFQEQDPHLNAYLSFKVIHYIDYKCQDDRERLYVEIVRNTIRNTKVTTLLRFFVNGNNLYLAADSYALGRLKKRGLVFQSIVLLVLIPSLPFLFSLLVIPAIMALWYLYSTWIKLIRVLFQGEPFPHALRLNFPKNIKGNAFDLDDIYMFLKGIYPLIISSLEESLSENGLSNEDLETILKDIRKNIGQSSININTGGGGIFGAIIGGINNAINN